MFGPPTTISENPSPSGADGVGAVQRTDGDGMWGDESGQDHDFGGGGETHENVVERVSEKYAKMGDGVLQIDVKKVVNSVLEHRLL